MIEAKGHTHWTVDSLSSLDHVGNSGEFPIRDGIAPCESGHGYVLRMSVANYLGGLPAVKKMLGKTRFSVLEDVDATQIAKWFGADPDEMGIALGATGIGKSNNDFEFCGHWIGRSYFVNRMYPRVCALCLVKEPYCKNYWEVSLSTACHLHGVTLMDSCPWCGDQLSWNRPTVTTCQCGGNLNSKPKASYPTALECAISHWIARKVNPLVDPSEVEASQKIRDVLLESTLIRLLKPLTLSGGMQLIYALGTAERSNISASYISHRKKSSTVTVRDLVHQADAMVGKLMTSQYVDFRKSSLTTVVNLLAEIGKANSAGADRSLAHSLIHVLLRRGGRANWRSRHPQLSQHELF